MRIFQFVKNSKDALKLKRFSYICWACGKVRSSDLFALILISTKKKLCGILFTPLFMEKLRKISLTLTLTLSRTFLRPYSKTRIAGCCNKCHHYHLYTNSTNNETVQNLIKDCNGATSGTFKIFLSDKDLKV